MLVRNSVWIVIAVCTGGILANSVLADAPPPSADTVVEIGKAVNALDADRLLEFAGEMPEQVIRSDACRHLPIAAWVLASASGDHPTTEAAVSFAGSDKWSKELVERYAADASDLKARPIVLSADSVETESLAWAKQLRRELLISAVTGQSDRIERLQRELLGDSAPKPLLDELGRIAIACQKIAPVFSGSLTHAAINRSNAARKQQFIEQRRIDEMLGEYRATPPKDRGLLVATRGGENAFSVMQAREQQRSLLVEAYSKLYDSYTRGELRRAEVMKKLQEVEAGKLDLVEKRAILIWMLRKKRAENNRAKKEARIAENRASTQALQQRTASDLSASWPSLFRHRDLRSEANSLLVEMREHSPSNCGPLSICYGKCLTHIRELKRLLETDLEQLDSRQRAGLRSYLDEIGEELQGPYQNARTIAAINASSASSSGQFANAGRTQRVAVRIPESVSVSLGGDDRELASFGLFQSIASSLIQAGKAEDFGTLRNLAVAIESSKLLTAEHKATLKSLGSRAYHGKVTRNDLALCKPAEDMLAQIANVDSVSLASGFQVDDATRDEAFEILLASMLQPQGSATATDSTQ